MTLEQMQKQGRAKMNRPARGICFEHEDILYQHTAATWKVARTALLTELTQTIQAIDFYGWNEQTQSKIKEKVQAHLDELINPNRLELDNP